MVPRPGPIIYSWLPMGIFASMDGTRRVISPTIKSAQPLGGICARMLIYLHSHNWGGS
ncbi:hypothetical [Yersinia pestis KIM10+]|uniref:Uncharacterized protein n=2 Tax=Yersinia pestis TaxID=632 RepID=Q8CL02_YERPE|nr:hypothetical [Yersinia pestis KIM10+]